MKRKLIITFLNLTLIFLAGTFNAFGQGTELEDKRVTLKVKDQSVRLIFHYLMSNYGIPIGFEESMLDRNNSDFYFITNPSPSKLLLEDNRSIKLNAKLDQFFKPKVYPISVNIDEGKLEDVLNQVVKQMKNYKWEINDGVVNIFPIKDRDERFKELLEQNIKEFNLEKGQTVEDITTKLLSSQKVLEFLKTNNLVFTGIRNGNESVIKAQYGRAINEEINFSNLTLKELLNKITKIKKGGWILKWKWISDKTGKEYIDIDI